MYVMFRNKYTSKIINKKKHYIKYIYRWGGNIQIKQSSKLMGNF